MACVIPRWKPQIASHPHTLVYFFSDYSVPERQLNFSTLAWATKKSADFCQICKNWQSMFPDGLQLTVSPRSKIQALRSETHQVFRIWAGVCGYAMLLILLMRRPRQWAPARQASRASMASLARLRSAALAYICILLLQEANRFDVLLCVTQKWLKQGANSCAEFELS